MTNANKAAVNNAVTYNKTQVAAIAQAHNNAIMRTCKKC